MPALSLMSKDKAMSEKRGRAPRMLVLAPTRELAMQSQKVLEEFGKVVNLTSVVVSFDFLLLVLFLCFFFDLI
jgi:ATP-dependent RNA helicase DBP3